MDAEELQIHIFKNMSARRKLELSMNLYYSARKLKTGWLRQIHPDWSDKQVEREVREIFKNART
ncbi:MAG: hypothetical protein JW860_08395 [Sedimentisphaerales bacterium]|nr:hypothetical protein [Sedimentisphaerales bacterium]